MMDTLLNRRGFLRTVGTGVIAGAGLIGTATAHREKWNVELEAVEGVRRNPHGGGVFERGGDTMSFALDANGLTSNITAAHIHHEQPLGTVVTGLYPGNTTDSAQRGSTFDAKGMFTGDDLVNTGVTGVGTLDDLISEIRGGNAFVRAHSEENPPGEVFGVIR